MQNDELVKKLEKANRDNKLLLQVLQKNEALTKSGNVSGTKAATKNANKYSQPSTTHEPKAPRPTNKK